MVARLFVPSFFFALLAPVFAQQTCTFTFSPNTWNFPIGGGSKQVTINASSGSCSRPGATTDSSWISLAGAIVTGTGNGLLGIAVTSNTDGPPRQGTVSVGDAKMIITQDGATCTFKLGTDTTPMIPSWGANASLAVTPAPAKCGFTATSGNPDWIHLTSTPPAIGPGTVFYTVDPNPGSANRTGSIAVGNRAVMITQDGSGCRFSVDTPAIQSTADGQSGSIGLTANGPSCAWQASSGAAWLNLSVSGTGSGSVPYTIPPNGSASPRSATLSIGGVQVVVNQDGKQCAISLSPGSLFLGGASLTGSISITAPDGCSWQTDSDATWLNVTSGASGSGSGTIAYSAPSNTTGQRRYGILNVGGVALPITQDVLNCGTTATPASFSLPAAGGSGTSAIASACDWAAWPSVPWIQIAAPAQGSSAGNVNFTAAANTSPSARSGVIQTGPAAIIITQDAQNTAPSTCAATLLTQAAVSLPAAGGASTVRFTSTGCNWSISTSLPWINLPFVVQGSGDSTFAFAATPNTSTTSRTATIQIGLAKITVTQAGQAPPPVCPVTITSPTTSTVPAIGAAGVLTFTADASCSWTVSTPTDWITVISGSTGQGNGLAAYVVDRNLTASSRTGTITVNGATFTVKQSGPPVITKEGVTNAASFKNGPVAPGEIVTIFGSGIGATPMATLQLTDDQSFVTTRLAGTEILFDGIAAPVILSSDGQLSTVVPYEVSGQSSTYLQVWYQDNVSNPVQLDVVPAAPAIFTQSSTGTGPGAIRNQDYSVNTAANPAPRGSTIMVFATGEGQTNPGGVDGKLTGTDVLPQPLAPVTVSIGGKDAVVSYAGSAPYLIAGVLQVNAVIPDGIQPGAAVPITITIGGVPTPDGVTVAVK